MNDEEYIKDAKNPHSGGIGDHEKGDGRRNYNECVWEWIANAISLRSIEDLGSNIGRNIGTNVGILIRRDIGGTERSRR